MMKSWRIGMLIDLQWRESHNKSFKPFATLTRTFGTPCLVAHGSAIIAQKALRTKRRLTGRYA